jgi:glucose-1-phosphate thymidylyltransferase
MKCLILAGGFATRLYPLTLNRAKALLEFRGRPVIDYIIERIPSYMDVLVSTNRKFEVDFLQWQKSLKREVEICIEDAVSDEQKKGAVGAVAHWITNKNMTDDLLLIAADNYFDLDLTDMTRRSSGRNATVAVYDVGEKEKACEVGQTCQVGLVTLEGSRIVRLDEKPPVPTSSIVATGIYILPARVFPLLFQYCREGKRDNLGSFIAYLLEREQVDGYVFKGTWLDIGDEIRRGRLTV